MIFDTVPCWWKLGWSPSNNSLLIHIAEPFIAVPPPIPLNSPLMRNAQKKVKEDLFSTFSADLTASHFGFNQSIKRIGERDADGFVTFSVPLPQARIKTGMACAECGGTGERIGSPGDNCMFCDGSKMEMVYEWNNAFSITESLQILFWLLEIEVEAEMPTNKMPQLLRLNLCAERDSHGSSLCGDLSKDGLKLFDSLAHGSRLRIDDLEKRMSVALAQAWNHIIGNRVQDKYNLRAEIRSDSTNLFLTCPGDAAGIYTVNEKYSVHSRCQISSHNMDNPAQALTCLAGLAVFCEELEKMWHKQRKLLAVLGNEGKLTVVQV